MPASKSGFKIALFIILIFPVSICSDAFGESVDDYKLLGEMPENRRKPLAFIGLVGDNVIVAGGKEQAAQTGTEYSAEIYIGSRQQDGYVWSQAEYKLPRGLCDGISIPVNGGMFLAGGLDESGPNKDLISLQFKMEHCNPRLYLYCQNYVRFSPAVYRDNQFIFLPVLLMPPTIIDYGNTT